MLLIASTAIYAQTNIYNSNGSLTSTRTVNLNGFNLTFQTNSGPLFINASSGNLGINTTSPTEKLDVNGNIQAKIGYFTNSLSNGQTFSSFADRNFKCRVLTAGTLVDASNNYRTLNYYDFPQSNLDTYPEVHFDIDDRGYKTRLRFFAKQNFSSRFVLFDKSQTENFSVIDDGANNISLIMQKANSFIGIGTTSFSDGQIRITYQ